ncbi:MAG TPA: hypothetical protein VE981_05680 [Planctomycetota bacterium]|nr:hypothetical protein [Planctomycetota bacterium]
MRHAAALLLLVLAAPSCSTETVDAKVQAQKAFEDWVHTCIDGESMKVFHSLSDGYKSGWLFDRFREGDTTFKRWRAELSGTARTDLDLWLGVAKMHDDGRTEGLPSDVLLHPSFTQLFSEYFIRTHDGIKVQMSRYQIAKVYGDNSGVTIVVKNGLSSTEMYGLIYERDGWKIDAYRQPLTGGR